ncbi:VOC family protein [Agrobacterium cavarae]|uniref:VOC family protein n=1 Tax=Agrobacterium cavarae TaxID=2528239 RepID=UPI003FD5B109
MQPLTVRVARPSDNLDALRQFYCGGLGLELLGEFAGHDGFDGIMVGQRGVPYHFEFTKKAGHPVGRAPTEDNLIVFYIPDQTEWSTSIARMVSAGFAPVPSFNPYWDRNGKTFEDPDGYRVVLQHAAWE